MHYADVIWFVYEYFSCLLHIVKEVKSLSANAFVQHYSHPKLYLPQR